MPAKPRKILVTSALPYANGPIHIGHLVEYVQTDIWVRYQRLAGHDVTYLCASDAHGTPIMLKAREAGITPEALVERFRTEHQQSFAGFRVDFDNYYTTHSEENRELVEHFYAQLSARGLISQRVIQQAYDAEAGMFLPDRFIRGNCPVCGAPDQYGDSCENCGCTYSPSELKNPRSVVSGATPIEKDSVHYFFRLAAFEESLRRWHAGGHVHESVARKLQEWFSAGLRDWDISRDAPYFGFRIPGTDDKYFYVWLDAPVGYMASHRNWLQRTGRPDTEFAAAWGPDSPTELHHFIGKDILYFHTLFWPALLEGAGFRKPTAVHVHGFLTVNGQKMSKSRGTFIAASTYLKHLDPEYLRYYYAFKLGSGLDDIDLSLDDFVARVNADLVGKVVNLASRCAGFISQRFDGQLAAALDAPALYREFVAAGGSIGAAFDQRDYGRAMRETMQLADAANRYIDDQKPWVLAREPAGLPRVQLVCTQGLNLFRVLMTYLAPVLPRVAEQAAAFLRAGSLGWAARESPLLGSRIAAYEPLLVRIDPGAISRMVEDSMEKPGSTAAPATTAASGRLPAGAAPRGAATTGTGVPTPEIELADFQKVDLRIATVLQAEAVEGADKLVRLTLDVGTEQRTVLSGIKSAYAPADLVGRQVILVANLKPRKMRFGISQGMVLAAGGDAGLFLVGPDSAAPPGLRVT
ncbi:MAG: methionine--tRNA ligase [Gammaproteobacteria bacterium]|nr:methionine--tRNA ligase [Gammaproteobacteria bacterium]